MVVTSRWTRIGNAFKCSCLVVAAGYMCTPKEAYINWMGTHGSDCNDNHSPPCGPTVNTTKTNCESAAIMHGLNLTSVP